MRVYNYLYPNYVYQNNNRNVKTNPNVNFTGVKTIPTTFGNLSKETQKSLKNLHTNMDFIHDFFLKLARNPHKSIEIKKGYTDIIQKNRNSGISFNLPDNLGVLIIRRLLKNSNLMRFILEKDGKTTHFLTEDYTKSIANVNQKNPQLLPRTFKYMLPNEIKESNIEKYISYTDEKIQKYKTYLEQFNSDKSSISSVEKSLRERNAEKMRKYRAAKKQKKQEIITPESSVKVKTKLEKSDLDAIMKLFQSNKNKLPNHLIPKISPSGSILGFSLQTQDGATLKVTKRLNGKYGGNMAYLSFEKLFPNGERSYMSIDLNSYKFLKMKDAGKPLIRNHTVYDYSPEEIEKRGMVQKFQAYADEILKGEKSTDIKPEEIAKTEPKPKLNDASKPEKSVNKSVNEENIPDSNFEKLKQNTIKQAIEDAKTLSDLYFKTFTEEFNKNIIEKLNNFKIDIEKFFKNNI